MTLISIKKSSKQNLLSFEARCWKNVNSGVQISLIVKNSVRGSLLRSFVIFLSRLLSFLCFSISCDKIFFHKKAWSTALRTKQGKSNSQKWVRVTPPSKCSEFLFTDFVINDIKSLDQKLFDRDACHNLLKIIGRIGFVIRKSQTINYFL